MAANCRNQSPICWWKEIADRSSLLSGYQKRGLSRSGSDTDHRPSSWGCCLGTRDVTLGSISHVCFTTKWQTLKLGRFGGIGWGLLRHLCSRKWEFRVSMDPLAMTADPKLTLLKGEAATWLSRSLPSPVAFLPYAGGVGSIERRKKIRVLSLNQLWDLRWSELPGPQPL